MSQNNGNPNSLRLKTGLAEMLKGGVIMDVTNAEQAVIAEKAGAVSVLRIRPVGPVSSPCCCATFLPKHRRRRSLKKSVRKRINRSPWQQNEGLWTHPAPLVHAGAARDQLGCPIMRADRTDEGEHCG